MSNYTKQDDAMSTTSTLVPQQEVRTTLTGQPIEYKHDNLSNIVSGESSHVGANTLPPGYTDSSLVQIPIKTGKYLDPASTLGDDVKREQPKKSAMRTKIMNKLSGHRGGEKDEDGMKIVAMSRGDYLKYWAKGEDGKFRDSVVEPPEGRAEWLRNALERQEREGLGKVTMKKTRGSDGSAGAFGAAGPMIGGVVN